MFDSVISKSMNATSFFLCTITSVVLGFIIAAAYMYKNKKYTGSFIISLALLPFIVQIVISMVNGNIGVGVAVAGAFSLIRFRSAAGSAKEIVSVFACMTVGLATGMGYIGIAAIFSAIIIGMSILYSTLRLGGRQENGKTLKITIPEGLEYSGVFDDLFEEYTTEHELEKVKTCSMGSLYQLTYRISLKDERREKEFIDNLRCRNGNLDISCGLISDGREEL